MGRPDGPLGEFLDEFMYTPLSLNTAIRVEEAETQFENNSQLDTDLRNVRPGNGSVPFTNGRFEVQTSASGTSAQAIETASLAEYPAGLPLGVGSYIRKDTTPVGFAEWGYGGDLFDDGLYWRLESDGSYSFIREKGGTLTTISESLWATDTELQIVQDENENDVGIVTGLDPLDGSGPSGIDITPPVTALFGVDMVLYGGGGFAPWAVGADRRGRMRKVYPFVFEPAGEEILNQFNQPIFARLDNDGTATADSIITTERQATNFGRSTGPRRGTQHVSSLSKSVTGPTALIGARRRDAGGPTRLDIIDVEGVFDARCHVWFLVNPTVTNSPTWGEPVRDLSGDAAPQTETALEVSEDIEVDPSTGVSLDGNILEGGTGANAAPESTSFASSPFIRGRPVVVMIEPFLDGDVLSQDTVVNFTEGV